MPNRVLYYPFIRVPESDWLTRMLLYWDSVGSIIPYEFLQEPERLGEHTRQLVQEDLVRPVFPGEYLWEVPAFEDEFLGFLHQLGPTLEVRRGRFEAGEYAPIHLEKLGSLRDSLPRLGLAREDAHWSLVERETAEEFMAYLAITLGRLPEVDAHPVSDQEAGIACLASSAEVMSLEGRLGALRTAVLEGVFPAPIRPLAPAEIASFKQAQGHLLTRFRLAVEDEVIRLADLGNEELRALAVQNLLARIKEDTQEIEAKLQEAGFGGVAKSKWLAVLGNLPVVGQTVNLITSVSALFEEDEARVVGPFAYAGYVHGQLLG